MRHTHRTVFRPPCTGLGLFFVFDLGAIMNDVEPFCKSQMCVIVWTVHWPRLKRCNLIQQAWHTRGLRKYYMHEQHV